MQYKREEVRDMNLYGEILKKLEGTPCLALERSFVGEEGNLTDMRCELKEGAEASEIGKEALTQGQPVCGRAGSSWNVAEPFFPKERLIILGGGHVALPVAEFGARVGFLVTVVDDRLSFANPGRFPMAEKVICDDFGHAIKELKIQESDYICIVTRGHRHDADCLRMIGKGKETLFAFLTLIPLRAVSGGFHLKTHIGCFICSNVFYIGTVLLSTVITFESNIIKYIVLFSIWIFGIAMCILYAPADTDSLPILRKSERKVKKILSCIFLTAMLIAAIFVHNQVYSNMLWLGAFVQICSITRLAYIITNNKYGFETYKENGQIV